MSYPPVPAAKRALALYHLRRAVAALETTDAADDATTDTARDDVYAAACLLGFPWPPQKGSAP